MRAAFAALLVVCATALAFSGSVRLDELPPQARETLSRVEAGAPLPDARDGAIFSNRERQLPARERGYYREYTVKTPGVRGRGPRRIVAGRGGEYYYSDDHYRTFRRIIRQ